MAGIIRMSPDEVQSIALDYSTASDTINEMLTKLTSTQSKLDEAWEGSAFDSFDEQFQTLKPKVEQFAQLMEDINQQLNEIAEIIRSTDSEIASKVRGGL